MPSTRRSRGDAQLAPPLAFNAYDRWFDAGDAGALGLGADVPDVPSPSPVPAGCCAWRRPTSEPENDDQGFEVDNMDEPATAGEPEQEEEPDFGFSIDRDAPPSSRASHNSAVKPRRRRNASTSAQRAKKEPKMFKHKDAAEKKAVDVRTISYHNLCDCA